MTTTKRIILFTAALNIILLATFAGVWRYQAANQHDVFGNAPRSGHWPAVRKQHLEREPACVVCGRTGAGLQVHHILAYRAFPALELDDGKDGTGLDGNLVSICGPDGCNGHFWIGHCGRWKGYNPHIREDAKILKKRWDESKRLALE